MEQKPEKDLLREKLDELAEETALRYGLKRDVPYDNSYKRRINRMMRFLGFKKVPYPEVDNLWERLLSKVSNLRRIKTTNRKVHRF